MKAHHTQTHAPLRGHARSLLRAGSAPSGGRGVGSSPPGRRGGEGVRPLFGLSGVSLFFFFRSPLSKWWERGRGMSDGLFVIS